MAGGVPVLREHGVFKQRRHAVDDGHDGVILRHGQTAARHKAVLSVDDEQGAVAGKWHGF